MLDQSLQFKSGQGKCLPTVFELIHSMRVQVCLPDCEILTVLSGQRLAAQQMARVKYGRLLSRAFPAITASVGGQHGCRLKASVRMNSRIESGPNLKTR
jgi:hypothetical protein